MINNRLNLFIQNNKALKEVKGSMGNFSLMLKSNALAATIKNEKINVKRINEALDIIKHETSMFSNFRGLSKLTTAITISETDDMEESLREIISIYNKLKEKFHNSQYLVIAAQVIFNAIERINYYSSFIAYFIFNKSASKRKM